MKYFQQGDTLYFQETIPSSAVTTSFDGVIQHGEATGHAHRIDASKEELEEIYFEDKSTGKRYLRLIRPQTITHEEHKPITLPAGDYVIGIVREYDHFLEESRAVLD